MALPDFGDEEQGRGSLRAGIVYEAEATAPLLSLTLFWNVRDALEGCAAVTKARDERAEETPCDGACRKCERLARSWKGDGRGSIE